MQRARLETANRSIVKSQLVSNGLGFARCRLLGVVELGNSPPTKVPSRGSRYDDAGNRVGTAVNRRRLFFFIFYFFFIYIYRNLCPLLSGIEAMSIKQRMRFRFCQAGCFHVREYGIALPDPWKVPRIPRLKLMRESLQVICCPISSQKVTCSEYRVSNSSLQTK